MSGNATIAILSALAAAFLGCHAQPTSPLTIAAAAGDAAALRDLLARGADPNEKDAHGWNALMWAARGGHVEAARALLQAGADVDMRDTAVNGWTALMHAIHKGRTEMALALLEAGADVRVRAGSGATALMIAAAESSVEAVEAILARDPGPCDNASGYSEALAHAAHGCLFDCSDVYREPGLCSRQAAVVKAILDKAPGIALESGLDGSLTRLVARWRGCTQVLDLIEGRDGSRARS